MKLESKRAHPEHCRWAAGFILISGWAAYLRSPKPACNPNAIKSLASKGQPGTVQFSSVAQSCPTLFEPMNRSMPGPPFHHQLLEFTQNACTESVMPSSHLILSSPCPPAPNPSQHQSLFQWVNSSHEVAKVLEFQLQHHSLQRNPRADLF